MDPTKWKDVSDLIHQAWQSSDRRGDAEVVDAVARSIAALDAGELRVAEKDGDAWKVNTWVKEAVLLYFGHRQVEVIEHG